MARKIDWNAALEAASQLLIWLSLGQSVFLACTHTHNVSQYCYHSSSILGMYACILGMPPSTLYVWVFVEYLSLACCVLDNQV